MGWSYLTDLLNKLSSHSTIFSQVWNTFNIIFRIVIAAGGEIYTGGAGGEFTCNIKVPGCDLLCYSNFLPISHLRFWLVQMACIISPSAFYVLYATYKTSRKQCRNYQPVAEDEPEREEPEREEESKWMMQHKERSSIKRDGLMTAYMLQLVIRAIAETTFLFGQCMLFGLTVPKEYRCQCTRAGDTDNALCFISRYFEKTIFLRFMFSTGLICLLLNIIEMVYLAIGCCYDCWKGTSGNDLPEPDEDHVPEPDVSEPDVPESDENDVSESDEAMEGGHAKTWV